MKNISFLIIVILCLSFVIAQTLEGIALKVTLVNQEPDPVEPGRIVELKFKVENIGSRNAEDVTVEILPEWPFTLLPTEQKIKQIGSIHGKQIGDIGVIVKYKLLIDKNAPEGEHDIKLRYRVRNLGWASSWIELEPFKISVRTYDALLIIDSIITNPEIIAPGEKVKIIIKLKNMADSILRQIKIKLNLIKEFITTTNIQYIELPFTPVGSTNEKVIKQLLPNEKATVQFDLISSPDADGGIYKIPLMISYIDNLGKNYSRNQLLGLIIGEKPNLKVSLDSTEIYTPKSTGKIIIKFVNLGSTDIKFLYVRLAKTPDYEILSSQDVYIGKIDSDDYETAEFKLYINTEKKEIMLPLHISYGDITNKRYNEDINLKLKLYTTGEAKRYGIKKPNKLIGVIITLLIVGIGLFLYKRFKVR